METRTVPAPVAVHTLTDRDVLTRRVSELTKERDAALAAAAAERDRNAVVLQQCDHLASEIFVLRRGQAVEWKPRLVSDESRQLAFALETIRNMERSWFWRLRLICVRIESAIAKRAGLRLLWRVLRRAPPPAGLSAQRVGNPDRNPPGLV